MQGAVPTLYHPNGEARCPWRAHSEIYLVKSKQKPACAHGENSESMRWGLEGMGPHQLTFQTSVSDVEWQLL